MITAKIASRVRRGFTLMELLVVITIIMLISGLFLSLSPGNGGGLPASQRILASSLRSVRALALMNRGTLGNGIAYNARYRLLILNDPSDPANHLRQFVIAVGGVNSIDAGGVDPATLAATNNSKYTWFAPESPSLLPNGVYFIPPKEDTTTTINDPSGAPAAANTRRSIIGDIADNAGNALDHTTSPPWVKFAYYNQPTNLGTMSSDGTAKKWYYVELQPSGASNHLGRVMLVLANGVMRNDASGTAVLDLASNSQFAAIALRPNGDVSMTNDADEMNTTTLTK